MKKLSAIFFLFFLLFNGYAQERQMEITVERKSDNSIDFIYQKTDPGYFTVVFKFSELTNAREPQSTYDFDGYSGSIMTLTPIDKARGIGYRYSTRYIRGKFKPKVNKEFCYTLPYSPGTKCNVSEAGFANEAYFGAERPDDWKSYFFYTDQQESVTAIRKGSVVNIVDQYDDEANVAFTTKKNSVIVEQNDGTLVRYLGLKKGSIKVKVGDILFPNDVIGLNAPSAQKYFGVSVFIYYLSSVDFESLKSQTLSTPKSLYSIVTPKFITANNTCGILENKKSYESFSNEEIITKEMNKKELKKYKTK